MEEEAVESLFQYPHLVAAVSSPSSPWSFLRHRRWDMDEVGIQLPALDTLPTTIDFLLITPRLRARRRTHPRRQRIHLGALPQRREPTRRRFRRGARRRTRSRKRFVPGVGMCAGEVIESEIVIRSWCIQL